MNELIAPLNVVLFHFGQDAVTWAELLGFATGGGGGVADRAAHVVELPGRHREQRVLPRAVRGPRGCSRTPVAGVYIVLGFVGWWQWVRGGPRRTTLLAGHASRVTLVGCLAFVVLGTAGLTVLLTAVDDAAPFWDALTTAISLAAQWLLNAKKIENWFFWIAADIVYVPFYFVKNLYLTGVVYVLFLGMCLVGLRVWRRAGGGGGGMTVVFGHGLVIGKFYPPHAGHHFLIRAAADACDRVTVVAMASDVESIPLADRVAWLRAAHAGRSGVAVVGVTDNLPIDYDSDRVWAGHVALMVQGVRAGRHAPAPIDAVFSSEPYGAELARRLGAAEVRLDAGRSAFAVSGTKVRADPVAAWSLLEPPVRGWFAKRVVVVGAESTGTTTLSADLADALRGRGGPHALTQWVAEYGSGVHGREAGRGACSRAWIERVRAGMGRRGLCGRRRATVRRRGSGGGAGRADPDLRHRRAGDHGVAGALPGEGDRGGPPDGRRHVTPCPAYTHRPCRRPVRRRRAARR